MINFSNTQKLINLENKELHFKTRELALDYILENYPKHFSPWFIYKMFVNGRTNMSDWLKYNIEYRTKHFGHAFRRKNLDILMNKNTNIFHIIHQLDLHINDIFKKSNGVCILASLYSSYPRLFNYNIREVEQIISEIDNPRNIENVVNKVNEKLHSNILEIETRLNNDNFDELLRKYIDNDKYFVISETNSKKGGHCIVFVGYDYDSYYYFENGNNTLQELANTRETNYKNTKYHRIYKDLKTIRKSDMYNFGINFLIKVNLKELQNITGFKPIKIKDTIVTDKIKFSDLSERLQKLVIEASNCF